MKDAVQPMDAFNWAAAPGMREYLQRLQIAANLQSFQQGGVSGVSGGGRVGYRHPLENGSVTVGVSGGGHRVKADTPQGIFRDAQFGIHGMDANYTQGNYSVGMNANRQGVNQINARWANDGASLGGSVSRDRQGKPMFNLMFNKTY